MFKFDVQIVIRISVYYKTDVLYIVAHFKVLSDALVTQLRAGRRREDLTITIIWIR
jgi:hypothetical protein